MLIVLIILLFLGLNTDLLQNVISGNIQVFTSKIGGEGNIAYTLMITLIIMLIHNALPVIPLFLVVLINNSLLGSQFGLAWSVLTSTLCAVIVFLSARYALQDLIVKKVSKTFFSKVERNGFWYVLGTRLFPLAPTSMLNVVSGISNVRLSHFTFATAIVNLIFITLYFLLQEGLVSQGINKFEIGIVLFSGALLYYFIRKITSRIKISKIHLAK
ncbi:putative membrane protein YdjX (TVP38/TMEM64 family) [Planomicrobium soli]|uniref:TVP38/TMEM64 family membrane protein n=1 Tax=Planomicrobium soli TaxID=1176648 RepID=A0A2P8H3W7_9BACL|nr:VTT domain-containing protein [Planomicrobium soli]PSL40915.1 putative membrane protein YdjX (TVP38/TMEM64 family) [Planomicrobium soli]